MHSCFSLVIFVILSKIQEHVDTGIMKTIILHSTDPLKCQISKTIYDNPVKLNLLSSVNETVMLTKLTLQLQSGTFLFGLALLFSHLFAGMKICLFHALVNYELTEYSLGFGCHDLLSEIFIWETYGKTAFPKTGLCNGLHLRQIWLWVRNDIRKIKYKNNDN